MQALRDLLAEARSRCDDRRELTGDDAYVVVVDSRVYGDPEMLALVKRATAYIRRLALHLWVESATPPPRTVAVELQRVYCGGCVAARIIGALESGEVL